MDTMQQSAASLRAHYYEYPAFGPAHHGHSLNYNLHHQADEPSALVAKAGPRQTQHVEASVELQQPVGHHYLASLEPTNEPITHETLKNQATSQTIQQYSGPMFEQQYQRPAYQLSHQQQVDPQLFEQPEASGYQAASYYEAPPAIDDSFGQPTAGYPTEPPANEPPPATYFHYMTHPSVDSQLEFSQTTAQPCYDNGGQQLYVRQELPNNSQPLTTQTAMQTDLFAHQQYQPLDYLATCQPYELTATDCATSDMNQTMAVSGMTHHQLAQQQEYGSCSSAASLLADNRSRASTPGSSSSAASSHSSMADTYSDGEESHSSSTLTRDERKAREENIPMSYSEIVNLSIEQFNEQLSRYDLNESQLTLIKDIRRRGKNKVAAQSCRKRKMEQINELQLEVDSLIVRRKNMSFECSQLIERHASLLQEYDKIRTIIQEQQTAICGGCNNYLDYD